MRPFGRVLPFAGGALAGFRSRQPDEHRATGCIVHVANLPVIALLAPVGKIVAAHRLGLPAETLRQFGSVVSCHYAASRSEIRAMA